MDRRRFVMTSTGWALAAPAAVSALAGGQTKAAHLKPYGSGHFGEWVQDEFGLPAFHYTCDQTGDPLAVSPVTPGILSATDHVHQVGNDRIIAIVSNYGHVRVRQDEGAPKFLNDYVPEISQFSGGFGYLTDGTETLSTLYPQNGATFDRVFGAGYLRKKVARGNYSVDQVICAPFGDDPVLLSQVTIANHGAAPAALRWIEYWGTLVYEFSFRPFVEMFAGYGTPVTLRRRFGQRFTHWFNPVNVLGSSSGLLETAVFLGRAPEEEAAWQRAKANLAAHPNAFLGPIPENVPEASWDDLKPPATILMSLDDLASGFTTDGEAFFGSGGAAQPDGIGKRLEGQIGEMGPQAALLLERAIDLESGESRTLYFLFGYLTEGFKFGPLVQKYRASASTTLKDSSAEWKKRGMRFSVGSDPWVERETIWNHYCLRSSLTYDDYFHEHILNQNGIYQYVMGFQGAARDPLQHCLPFLFSDPEIVKTVLRYTLKEVRADGSIPYSIVGHGAVGPMVTDNSSDLPLWLLWTASEYVLASRDLAFLDQEVPTFPLYGPTAGKERVRKLLERCYRHEIDHVGVGAHGVMRMLNDDWNDGLLSVWAQPAFAECVAQGESVLNSAMAAWVFDLYARLLTYAGDRELAASVRRSADAHRAAAAKQWTGKWLRRAWLGPTLGWVGESTLWLEPQPWALLAGVTTPEQSRELIRTMDELLRRPSPIGAVQMGPGPDAPKGSGWEPGTSVSGGIWPSLNQTLVWALARHDPAMAWDEWKKNSLACHADNYPGIWYGVLSGPDTYNSTRSKHAGETVNNLYLHYTDFPVLNLHSHACSLYSAAKLIGLEFTESGLELRPGLPVESYRFESPLVGVVKSAGGSYEGWYQPSQTGSWKIAIWLPAEQAARLSHAEVNGISVTPARAADGTIELAGRSEAGKPLRWRLW
jgi:hypothetical protein